MKSILDTRSEVSYSHKAELLELNCIKRNFFEKNLK